MPKPTTTDDTSSPPTQQGWLCPSCGAGNAPWVARCNCVPIHDFAAPDFTIPGDWYQPYPFNWPPYRVTS